ncbi:MAG: helix-turn-helix transcriptional regulator [Coriobacteriales bacterium]|nr:helix-turn-helix transcriptional regulator [Coriobacteriales bacterium]
MPDSSQLLDLAWIQAMVFVVIGLACLMAFKGRISPLFDHPMLLAFSACLMSVGALLSGMTTQGVLPPTTLLFSAALASMSAAPLMMAWGELLGSIGSRQAAISASASVVCLGALLALLALGRHVSPWLPIVVPTLAPFVSLLAIVRSWRAAGPCEERTRMRSGRPFILTPRAGAAMLVYGVAVGFMLACAASAAEGAELASHLLFALGTALSGLLLLLLLMLLPSRPDFAILYRLILPLLAGVLLLLLSFDARSGGGLFAIVCALAWGYQISLSITLSARLANHSPSDAVLVFIKTSGLHFAGSAIGMLAWFLTTGFSSAPGPGTLPALTGIVVALILAGLFAFDGLLGLGSHEVTAPAPDSSIDQDARITEIARRYVLTPREAEVLALLAKGRNANYICREFVVSPHTARTHIKRIHSKLQVHSQQELLDLIDNAP